MSRVWAFYSIGVLAATSAGLISPWPFTGLLALAAGCIWAAYDLVEVTRGDAAPDKKRSPARRH